MFHLSCLILLFFFLVWPHLVLFGPISFPGFVSKPVLIISSGLISTCTSHLVLFCLMSFSSQSYLVSTLLITLHPISVSLVLSCRLTSRLVSSCVKSSLPIVSFYQVRLILSVFLMFCLIWTLFSFGLISFSFCLLSVSCLIVMLLFLFDHLVWPLFSFCFTLMLFFFSQLVFVLSFLLSHIWSQRFSAHLIFVSLVSSWHFPSHLASSWYFI